MKKLHVDSNGLFQPEINMNRWKNENQGFKC